MPVEGAECYLDLSEEATVGKNLEARNKRPESEIPVKVAVC